MVREKRWVTCSRRCWRVVVEWEGVESWIASGNSIWWIASKRKTLEEADGGGVSAATRLLSGSEGKTTKKKRSAKRRRRTSSWVKIRHGIALLSVVSSSSPNPNMLNLETWVFDDHREREKLKRNIKERERNWREKLQFATVTTTLRNKLGY